ncbi:MAG: HAD hydrolase-like protein [Halocynthiibacter sp.]
MQTVFIDLDGTLIDPKPGITRSIRHALLAMGREAPGEDALEWCIGPPLLDSFRQLGVPDAELDRTVAHYRERFTDAGLFEAVLYDGALDMLAALRDTGARLWLATSKPHEYARTICDHFGIAEFLGGVFGAELDFTRSDKTELLAHALSETATDAGRATMLGDRKHDVIGASNNGLRSIGALWGYGGRAELEAAGASLLAKSPGDVPGL